ncbi:HPF/RaiA family ribosome-associated protein [Cupriavidus necator]
MRTAISYRNISERSHSDVEDLIGKLVTRHLQRHLSHFPPELTRLHATLERSGHRSFYRARLRLGLPSTILAADSQSPGLRKALEQSFGELERQLERHLVHLRQQDEWRRQERRTGLRQLKAALADHADAERELFGELVRPLLPEFRRFVQRELAHLQARGDLAPGDPDVDEVVDESLARALASVARHPRRLAPLPWLYQIAITRLAEEVRHRQAEAGRWISLEGRLPVQLREPQEDDDQILYEYWQPDEILRLEDVMPAPGATPEEEVSASEMRRLVAALIADLPTSWRRAMELCRVETLPRAAAAQVLRVSEQEIESWLVQADAFLQAKLAEMRLTPQALDVAGNDRMPAVPPPAPQLTRDFDEVIGREAPT